VGVSTRKKLAKLVEEYGEALYEDERRCRSLLLDVIKNSRDVAVLSAAVSAGIVNDLKSSTSDMPFEARARVFAKRLHNEYGLSEDFALWSVESWALALGVVTEDDIATKKTNRSRNADERSKQTDAKPHDVAKPIDSARDEKCYRDTLDRDSYNADYAFKLAQSLEGKGEYFKAEQFYLKALAYQPGNLVYLKSLGKMLANQDRTEEALQFLTKAASLDPADFESRTIIGVILLKNKDYARAFPYLQDAVKLNPTDAYLQCMLGFCLLGYNQPNEAKPYFRKAIELDENYADAHYGLAWVLFLQKRFKDAKYHLGRAIIFNPTNADYRSLADKISSRSSSSSRGRGSESSRRKSQSSRRSSASSGEDDCFVATACFGDADAHEVRLLRIYRDEILVRSRVGRAFISWYYTHGPRFAESIRHRPAVKLVVRNLLIRPCALMAGLFLRIKQNVGA